ncbi:MAG: hypothetical protein AVDCRST_MAG19-171, partial [uncultured Thermomicrobiales bacterium]
GQHEVRRRIRVASACRRCLPGPPGRAGRADAVPAAGRALV